MKIAALIFGALAVLLGGLWLLQGLGLVQIDPVACVAECAPLEGPSLQWAAIGLAVLVAGLAGVWYGIKPRTPRQHR